MSKYVGRGVELKEEKQKIELEDNLNMNDDNE